MSTWPDIPKSQITAGLWDIDFSSAPLNDLQRSMVGGAALLAGVPQSQPRTHGEAIAFLRRLEGLPGHNPRPGSNPCGWQGPGAGRQGGSGVPIDVAGPPWDEEPMGSATVERARRVMSRRAASWVVAAAFLVTMVGTTLPTSLYPLYQQRFGFGGLMVTIIFATYAAGVLAVLLLVGQLSDQIGRRAVLLPGLAFASASALAFLIPGSMPALFLGRVLSGLSADVFTGAATAAIIDLAPEDRRRRAGLVAAAVTMLGLGLGPVLSGFLAQYAPWPLQLSYLMSSPVLWSSRCSVVPPPDSCSRSR